MIIAVAVVSFAIYAVAAHYYSYYIEKTRVLALKTWDLNICCGKTDGGGMNVDIFKHEALPRFKLIDDIYHLPFGDRQFDHVLCSHTLEHVDDPVRFFAELKRVGKHVTVVVPPLYDIFAAINFFEHKFIFLTFKKTHLELPPFMKLPFSEFIQKRFGQINHA